MRKLFILRGAPGSGKSSFIARHHLLPYAIGRDTLRLLLADLTVFYDEDTDKLRQVAPRFVTDEMEALLAKLVEQKMSRGETVIVDGTHVAFDAIMQYKPLAERYRYEVFVIDLMFRNSLEGLLKRNEIRMQYDWVKPEVIKAMYGTYQANPEVPSFAHKILPIQMDRVLHQKETNLDHYHHVVAVPDGVAEEDFPHVHISNFYFSFNDKFNEKYGTYRNVIALAKTEKEAVEDFKIPFFVFKYHRKHFLISAKPIRNEMLEPVHKVKGVWSYKTGLYNVADFMKDIPESKKPVVHQFNLSKLDKTRLLYIW
ncbi:MAG: AAA family ATPase [Lactobacillus sp.]|nr:AAA family ATPase [Lactobacillus sp.]